MTVGRQILTFQLTCHRPCPICPSVHSACHPASDYRPAGKSCLSAHVQFEWWCRTPSVYSLELSGTPKYVQMEKHHHLTVHPVHCPSATKYYTTWNKLFWKISNLTVVNHSGVIYADTFSCTALQRSKGFLLDIELIVVSFSSCYCWHGRYSTLIYACFSGVFLFEKTVFSKEDIKGVKTQEPLPYMD